MTTNLTVSDIPIDNAGTIITKSVAAGVNGINSVSYFSSSYDASYQEALKGAMAVAQAKAQALQRHWPVWSMWRNSAISRIPDMLPIIRGVLPRCQLWLWKMQALL